MQSRNFASTNDPGRCVRPVNVSRFKFEVQRARILFQFGVQYRCSLYGSGRVSFTRNSARAFAQLATSETEWSRNWRRGGDHPDDVKAGAYDFA